MVRNGPLRAGTGKALTKGLFYETSDESKYPASYTTKTEDLTKDGVTYLSLKRLYLECLDPTEEEFIQLAFDGNRRQWERVTASPNLSSFFSMPYRRDQVWIEEWRSELEFRLRSLGVQAIKEELKKGGKSAFSAAKWLAEAGWKEKRGRPTKAEVEREHKLRSRLFDEDDAEWERMQEVERKFSVVSNAPSKK